MVFSAATTAIAGTRTATHDCCNERFSGASLCVNPRLNVGQGRLLQRQNSCAVFRRTARSGLHQSGSMSRGSRGDALVVSANLFGRLTRVMRGTVTFYGDAAVSQGEDPVKMLDTIVDDMQGDLIRMRQTSSQVLAAQRMLENKFNDAARSAEDWERRAMLAVRANSDELAREALRRKKAFSDLAASQKVQLDQHTRATESLLGSIRVMESKLQEAKGKKQTLKARAQSAEASKMVNEQLSGMLGGLRSSTNSSLAAFAVMEEKVMALEAEAEGAAMFVPIGDVLENRFAMLEGGVLGVDDELEKMKKSISAPSKRAELSDKMNEYGYININVR